MREKGTIKTMRQGHMDWFRGAATSCEREQWTKVGTVSNQAPLCTFYLCSFFSSFFFSPPPFAPLPPSSPSPPGYSLSAFPCFFVFLRALLWAFRVCLDMQAACFCPQINGLGNNVLEETHCSIHVFVQPCQSFLVFS